MYYIAQVNIALLKAPPGDPMVAGFFDNVTRINTLAESCAGFIWRYGDDYEDDPMLAFNLSVWQNIKQLGAFVFRSAHVDIMRRKEEWMHSIVSAHAGLWWIQADRLATPNEAIRKLDLLSELGPSTDAFTFSHRFPSPDSL